MHVSAIARPYVHTIDRKRKRTQINARKRSLRLTRGRFLCANAIAFCALDLKLSGCIQYYRSKSFHVITQLGV